MFKTPLLRGQGSQSLQIFTSGSGSWCLTYVPTGRPSPKKLGAKFFSPLRVGDVGQTISSDKAYPKLVLKFCGLPKNLQGGSNLAQISWFSAFFAHVLITERDITYLKTDYQTTDSSPWDKEWCTLIHYEYVIAAHSHPPMGGGTPTRRSSVELIF